MKHILKKNGGFTLVELMISMTLALVFIGGLIQIMTSNRENSQMQDVLVDMNQNARNSLEFMIRELKSAVSITEVTATSVTFYMDNSDAEIGIVTAAADVIPPDNTATLTDTSRAWTVNSWAGKTVSIVGVAGNDQIRTIVSNSSTQLRVPAWDVGKTPTADRSVYHIGVTLRKFILSGNTILYTRGEVVDEILADAITGLQFSLLAENGGRQRLEIQLTTEASRADPVDGTTPYFTVRSSVKLRN